MAYNRSTFTRGRGLLEPLLAKLRARRAYRLIQPSLRAGRILNIGCGSFPYFLAHTSFEEKFSIDQLPMAEEIATRNRIDFFTLNLDKEPLLPFEDEFFTAVTLLAVVEHLNPISVSVLFKETYRVLKSSGVVIITTPPASSHGFL